LAVPKNPYGNSKERHCPARDSASLFSAISSPSTISVCAKQLSLQAPASIRYQLAQHQVRHRFPNVNAGNTNKYSDDKEEDSCAPRLASNFLQKIHLHISRRLIMCLDRGFHLFIVHSAVGTLLLPIQADRKLMELPDRELPDIMTIA
jgi:hypothetical protein